MIRGSIPGDSFAPLLRYRKLEQGDAVLSFYRLVPDPGQALPARAGRSRLHLQEPTVAWCTWANLRPTKLDDFDHDLDDDDNCGDQQTDVDPVIEVSSSGLAVVAQLGSAATNKSGALIRK